MDKEELKKTLLDESKVKQMVKDGFSVLDTEKKGYITFEALNQGILGKMAAIGMDTNLLPPEVMNRVKSIADPKNEGKVNLENGTNAVFALIKIAKDTNNL